MIRTVNATMLVLVTVLVTGLMLTNAHKSEAAYEGNCKAELKYYKCPRPGKVKHRLYGTRCATGSKTAGQQSICCVYKSYNTYCLRKNGIKDMKHPVGTYSINQQIDNLSGFACSGGHCVQVIGV